MGVTGLWSVVEPVKNRTLLSDLRGQTLAVDLSIWVCENQGVWQMQHKVKKPYLRNLFFRVCTLLRQGVQLVFVVEGEAPALKQEEMKKRLKNRNPGKQMGRCGHKYGRSSFKVLLKECCRLLDAVGVPYIQSQGEAERLCAALNAAGIVDGCISDDSDCFLYGARTVYRNLSTDARDPHVEKYCMTDIETQLNLTREKLVALALMTGCDYFPAGIPGVGEAWAVKLMSALGNIDVLARFSKWREMTHKECINDTEAFVWQRAVRMPEFPPRKVIEEFLVLKERMPSSVPCWQRPNMKAMMVVGTEHLDWPSTYSVEKALPLITLWDLLDLSSPTPSGPHLQPLRILKKRTRQHTDCLEVEWCNDTALVDESGQTLHLVTTEEQELFEKVFPDMVSQFVQLAENSKGKRKQGARPQGEKKKTESLTNFFSILKIHDDEQVVSTKSSDTFAALQTEAEEEPDIVPLSQRLQTKLSKTGASLLSCSARHSKADSLQQAGINQTQHSMEIKEKEQYCGVQSHKQEVLSYAAELQMKDGAKFLQPPTGKVDGAVLSTSCILEEPLCKVVQSNSTEPASVSNSLAELDTSSTDDHSFVSDGHFSLQFSFSMNLADCSQPNSPALHLAMQSPVLFNSPLLARKEANIFDSCPILPLSSLGKPVQTDKITSFPSQNIAALHDPWLVMSDISCQMQEESEMSLTCKNLNHMPVVSESVSKSHDDSFMDGGTSTNHSTKTVLNLFGVVKTCRKSPRMVEDTNHEPENCDLPLSERLKLRLAEQNSEALTELTKLTSFLNLDGNLKAHCSDL